MNRPYIVAEVGANHLGSIGRALQIMDAAKRAGADAVKFQTFTPEQMANPGQKIPSGPWAGHDLLELYRTTCTPRAWHPLLYQGARFRGITAFSSVFHPDDVAFLETLACPMYKIASFELTDTTLIAAAARTGKPIIISTGMATEDEIVEAIDVWDLEAPLEGYDYRKLTLLKCTSAYPARPEDANLATMVDLMRHDRPVGLSDHTAGIGVAVAAAALGATMIEKHMTLRRSDGGPDAAFSMEPEEFAQMVTECRRAAAAIGTVRYGPLETEGDQTPLRRPPGGRRSVKPILA